MKQNWWKDLQERLGTLSMKENRSVASPADMSGSKSQKKGISPTAVWDSDLDLPVNKGG